MAKREFVISFVVRVAGQEINLANVPIEIEVPAGPPTSDLALASTAELAAELGRRLGDGEGVE